MLPDHEIVRLIESKIIGLDPFDPDLVQPASIDVRLCSTLRVPSSTFFVDIKDVPPGHTEVREIENSHYVLPPGGFILASTEEVLTLPDDIVARVEGKSSVGRLGVAAHITAGFIDPGFSGQVTLEVANLAPWAITLYPGMKIAQIAFTVLDAPSERPYGSKGLGNYQGQRGPTESRYRFT